MGHEFAMLEAPSFMCWLHCLCWYIMAIDLLGRVAGMYQTSFRCTSGRLNNVQGLIENPSLCKCFMISLFSGESKSECSIPTLQDYKTLRTLLEPFLLDALPLGEVGEFGQFERSIDSAL